MIGQWSVSNFYWFMTNTFLVHPRWKLTFDNHDQFVIIVGISVVAVQKNLFVKNFDCIVIQTTFSKVGDFKSIPLTLEESLPAKKILVGEIQFARFDNM